MAKVKSTDISAKTASKMDSLKLKTKKQFHKKKTEKKKITRSKIKKSALGKVNLFSFEKVTTQTRSKVTSEESDREIQDVVESKSHSSASGKSIQDNKEGTGNTKTIDLKQSPKKNPSMNSNTKTNVDETKETKIMTGKSMTSQKDGAKGRNARRGRGPVKSTTDVYKSRHNIGKRAASGRVFSYKETEISLVFPDNYWSSSSCKVDLALPQSSSSSSRGSSKSSSGTSEESDFTDSEIQFNFDAQKKRTASQEDRDNAKRGKSSRKKSEQQTPSKQSYKTRQKSSSKKSCDSDSSSEEDEEQSVKKSKKVRPSAKNKRAKKRKKSKAFQLQPRSPRIQRTACLNANAINSLMYDYSTAPKKPKTHTSPDHSQESCSDRESSDSNTEMESLSEEEKRPSPRKGAETASKYKKKEVPQAKNTKGKKKPKVPDKKKVPKKRKKRDVFDDVIISVPAKRMASLNAQAIMAACKDFEEMKPVKLPKEQKPPKEVKEKQEKPDKPAIFDATEKPDIKSPSKSESKEQSSPVKRKKSPLRGMKLLQRQILESKRKIEPLDKQARHDQEPDQHQMKSGTPGKDPYEFIDVVDVEERKSPPSEHPPGVQKSLPSEHPPGVSRGLKTAAPVSSPEIQVVDPPPPPTCTTIPNQSPFQPVRQVVPTAKPVPQYPRLNMPYRMNEPQIRHSQQTHFSHGDGGGFSHHHQYPHNSSKVSMPQALPNQVAPSSQASPFQRPPSHRFNQLTQQQQSTFHGQNQVMYRGGHPPVQSVPPYPPATYSQQTKPRYEVATNVPTTNISSVATLGASPPPAAQMILQQQEDSSPSSDRSSSTSTEKSTGPSHIQAHKTTQMGNTATYPYPHVNTGQNVNSQYMQSQTGMGGGGVENFGPYHQMIGNARHYGAHSAFGPAAYQPMVQQQRQDNSGTTNHQTPTGPQNIYMRYGYYQPAGPLIQHPGGTAFHLMQQQPHLKNFMPPAIVHSQPFRSHGALDTKAKNMAVNKPMNETLSKSPCKSAKSSQEKSKVNVKALDLSIESKSTVSGSSIGPPSVPSESSKPALLPQPSPMKPTKDILDLDSKKVRVHKGAVGESDRGSPLKTTTKSSSAKKLKTDGSGFPVQTYKFEPKQSQMGPVRPNVAFVQGCRGNVMSTNTLVEPVTAAETKTVASNMTIPFYSMPLSGHVTRMVNPNFQMAYSCHPKLEKSPKKGMQVKNTSSKGKPEQVPVNVERSSLIRPAVHMQLPQMMKPVMPVLPIPSVPIQPQTYPQAGIRPSKSGDVKPAVVTSTVSGVKMVTKDNQLNSKQLSAGGQVLSGVTPEVKKGGAPLSLALGRPPFPAPEDRRSGKKDLKKADTKSLKRESSKSKEAKISKQEVMAPEKLLVPSPLKLKPDSPRQKQRPEFLKFPHNTIKERHGSSKGSSSLESGVKVKSDKCRQTLQFTGATSKKDDPRLKHEFLKRKLEMKQKGDLLKNSRPDSGQKGKQEGFKLKPDSTRFKQDGQKGKSDVPKQKSDVSSKIKIESPKLKPDSPKAAKSESPRQRPDSLKIKPDSPRQQQKTENRVKVETPKSKTETPTKQKKEGDGVKNGSSGKKERRRSAEEKKLSPGNGGRRRIQSAPPVIHCAWRWEGLPELKPVSFQGEPAVLRKCYPAVRHTDGDIVKLRDCVLVKSGPRKRDIPFVAKIAALWEHQHGEMMMSVLWYYRPEQTEMERLPRRERCEIFASRHRDVVPVACIDDKAYVLTLNEFCRYKSEQRRIAEHGSAPSVIIPQLPEGSLPLPPLEAAAETVFLCRRVYDVKLKRILKNPQASYIQQSPNSSKPHTPNSSSKSSSPHSQSPIDTHFQQQQSPAKVDLVQFMRELAQLRYSEDLPSETVVCSSGAAVVKTEVGVTSPMASLPVFPSTITTTAGGFSGVLARSTPLDLPVVKTDLTANDEQKPEILTSNQSVVPEKRTRITSSLRGKPMSSTPFRSYFSSMKQPSKSSMSDKEVSNVVRPERCDVVVKVEESCYMAEADTHSVSSTETEIHKLEPSGPANLSPVKPLGCSSSTSRGQQVQETSPDTCSGRTEDTGTSDSSNMPSASSGQDLKATTDCKKEKDQSDHIQEDKISSQNLNCALLEETKIESSVELKKIDEDTVCSGVSATSQSDCVTKPCLSSSTNKEESETDGDGTGAETVEREMVTEEIQKTEKLMEDEVEEGIDSIDRGESPDPDRLVIDDSGNLEPQHSNSEKPSSVAVKGDPSSSETHSSALCEGHLTCNPKEALVDSTHILEQAMDSETVLQKKDAIGESTDISEEAIESKTISQTEEDIKCSEGNVSFMDVGKVSDRLMSPDVSNVEQPSRGSTVGVDVEESVSSVDVGKVSHRLKSPDVSDVEQPSRRSTVGEDVEESVSSVDVGKILDGSKSTDSSNAEQLGSRATVGEDAGASVCSMDVGKVSDVSKIPNVSDAELHSRDSTKGEDAGANVVSTQEDTAEPKYSDSKLDMLGKADEGTDMSNIIETEDDCTSECSKKVATVSNASVESMEQETTIQVSDIGPSSDAADSTADLSGDVAINTNKNGPKTTDASTVVVSNYVTQQEDTAKSTAEVCSDVTSINPSGKESQKTTDTSNVVSSDAIPEEDTAVSTADLSSDVTSINPPDKKGLKTTEASNVVVSSDIIQDDNIAESTADPSRNVTTRPLGKKSLKTTVESDVVASSDATQVEDIAESTAEISSDITINPPASDEVVSSDAVQVDDDAATVMIPEKSQMVVSSQNVPSSSCTSSSSCDVVLEQADDSDKEKQSQNESEETALTTSDVARSILGEQIRITVDQSDTVSSINAVEPQPVSENSTPKQSAVLSPSGLKSPGSGRSRIEQIVTQIKMAGGASGGSSKPVECTASSTTAATTTDTVQCENQPETK